MFRIFLKSGNYFDIEADSITITRDTVNDIITKWEIKGVFGEIDVIALPPTNIEAVIKIKKKD